MKQYTYIQIVIHHTIIHSFCMFGLYAISWLLPYQLVLNSIIYFRFRAVRWIYWYLVMLFDVWLNIFISRTKLRNEAYLLLQKVNDKINNFTLDFSLYQITSRYQANVSVQTQDMFMSYDYIYIHLFWCW